MQDYYVIFASQVGLSFPQILKIQLRSFCSHYKINIRMRKHSCFVWILVSCGSRTYDD